MNTVNLYGIQRSIDMTTPIHSTSTGTM